MLVSLTDEVLDQIYQTAEAEFDAAKGKLLRLHFAYISDDNDVFGCRFEPPLLVRIDESHSFDEVDFRPDERGDLVDVFWPADALPGQLKDNEHVAWIDGPTYHRNGRIDRGSWAGVPEA